tara:strand:- start:116986 stop:117783 length:798 start_codon:yes stop_codon:yes gene_type:complete
MPSPPAPRRIRKAERRQQILLELKLKPHVRVADLAAQYGVSTETIRRDVADLSEDGHLRRAFGGASAPHPGVRRDLDERRAQRVAERETMARYAATLVKDGDTIMIDAGATTMEFARFLSYAGTQVVALTNSLQVAMILGQSKAARVLLAPGDYLPEEAAVTGIETVDFIARYNATACFLGASALSAAGVTEAIAPFVHVKRMMLRQSQKNHFLIDASKIGQTHLSTIATCAEINVLITDRAPSDAMSMTLKTAGAEILVPPPAP